MKVMQINCVYRRGSTGKIIYDLHTRLPAMGVDSLVCYGRGQKTEEPCVYKICGELYAKANHLLSRLTGLMYGGCMLSTARLCRIIQKEQPDIVHLHCINGYFVNLYRLISWLKRHHIRTVLTLHAEFPYTANCGHALDCERWKSGCGSCPRLRKETESWLFDRTHRSWEKLSKAYRDFDELEIVSVSPWLQSRALCSPMLAQKPHFLVLNGIDTAVFHPCQSQSLRKALRLGEKRVVLHVSAEFSQDKNHLKGGAYILALAKRLPDTEFLVAGRCTGEIDAPQNLHLLGQIQDQGRLAELYSLADVTVLTGKRETFSMPVAESLCCGTPVVGFCAGAPEEIALPGASRFVAYGDLDALECAVRETLAQPKPNCVEAEARYSADTMTKNYLRIYQKEMPQNEDCK